jgi:hypothetical protein
MADLQSQVCVIGLASAVSQSGISRSLFITRRQCIFTLYKTVYVLHNRKAIVRTLHFILKRGKNWESDEVASDLSCRATSPLARPLGSSPCRATGSSRGNQAPRSCCSADLLRTRHPCSRSPLPTGRITRRVCTVVRLDPLPTTLRVATMLNVILLLLAVSCLDVAHSFRSTPHALRRAPAFRAPLFMSADAGAGADWQLSLRSPCKLNLFLRILGRRPNGFREFPFPCCMHSHGAKVA